MTAILEGLERPGCAEPFTLMTLVLELVLELPPFEDVGVEPGLVAVFAGAAAVDIESEKLFLDLIITKWNIQAFDL